ncbi:hypothetical protein [Amycolatopsis orientalis]|nr:hypothetical protein [Amycolatopsis orientalis]
MISASASVNGTTRASPRAIQLAFRRAVVISHPAGARVSRIRSN